MKLKTIFLYLVSFLLILFLSVFTSKDSSKFYSANVAYKVYLGANEIALISDEAELYNIIDKKQTKIKENFQVDKVYPPNELNLIKVDTFGNEFDKAEEVYKKIEEESNFAIKGYSAIIKKDEEEIKINFLDKDIFDLAVKKFIYSFIDEDKLDNYIEGSQDEIEDIGEYIESIYFDEYISIKENFISVNEKIFTNESELAQYLLFGPDAEMESYKVKLGDTIESISEAYIINTKEFLIANPEYKTDTTMLKVDSSVNVTILNPVLDMVVEVKKVEDVENKFMTKTKYDFTKAAGYSEVTQAGVTGIMRTTQHYKIVNGVPPSEVRPSESIIIREVVEQIVTKGSMGTSSTGTYVDNGLDWGWPTNYPYIITSHFGSRWGGSWHNGVDISGTGYGSPIYAIADGVVTQAKNSNGTSGIYVVISHGNDYYSSYLHLASYRVKPGDVVKRGQHIGAMGNTGWVVPAPTRDNPTGGTHLHLGFSKGEPYTTWDLIYYDPLRTIYQ